MAKLYLPLPAVLSSFSHPLRLNPLSLIIQLSGISSWWYDVSVKTLCVPELTEGSLKICAQELNSGLEAHLKGVFTPPVLMLVCFSYCSPDRKDDWLSSVKGWKRKQKKQQTTVQSFCNLKQDCMPDWEPIHFVFLFLPLWGVCWEREQ